MEFRHELVIPNDDLPFKMFIFEGKDGNHYKVSKHWHQSVEIFLVTDGEIDFYIDSRNYPLKRHQFVIVNSNEIHSIVLSGTLSESSRIKLNQAITGGIQYQWQGLRRHECPIDIAFACD